MAINEVANKRIPVTAEIWESLSKMKRPGQTYDSLLEEMIALKEEYDFLMHLEEIEKTGDFVSLTEAARELNIKGGRINSVGDDFQRDHC